jgi:hypothetical protein
VSGNGETSPPAPDAASTRCESAFGVVQNETTQTHETRAHLFKRIEELLGRPVVTFFTSFFFPVSVEDDDADMLEDTLRALDCSKGVALVISTPGGDGEAAERIINLFRSYSGTKEYWAIVPGKAKSAGTMICFGASKILMGPSSELGPVDPQIIFSEGGKRKQYSAYNLVKSFEDLFNGAEDTEGHIEPYIQQLQHYDARDIQRYKELIGLADDIGVKALKTGVMSDLSEADIRNKIERFLEPQQTKSHGRPIFREEARSCGLNIEDVDTSGEGWRDVHELYIRTNQLVSTRAAKCVESATASYTAGLRAFSHDE